MADTHVRIWVCLLRSACMKTNMPPTLTFRFLGMGFFCATLLECAARCTQTCLATLIVERLSIFPTWAVLFRGQFARFHIALHRPARPLSFGHLSCIRILVWSTVLWFRPCFQLGTWRTYDI